MGASIVGLALPLLKPAMQSPKAVVDTLQRLAKELKMAMFLAGAPNLRALAQTRVVESAQRISPLTIFRESVGTGHLP